MKPILTPVLLTALLVTAGFAAQAAVPQATAVVAADAGIELAKRGADDAAGDDRGGRGRGKDDGPNHTLAPSDPETQMARRGRGADDGAGHQRRGRGQDDGPNHT